MNELPAPEAALARLIREDGACRTRRHDLDLRVGIVEDLQPAVPVGGVLDLIEKAIHLLARGNVRAEGLHDGIHRAQLQERVIEGDEQDVPGRDAVLEQLCDGLIHDGRLSRAPCAAEYNGAADVLPHHAVERLKIGEAVHGLDEVLLDKPRPPPRVVRK